jgi:DNA-binding SARP family transcriptional activator
MVGVPRLLLTGSVTRVMRRDVTASVTQEDDRSGAEHGGTSAPLRIRLLGTPCVYRADTEVPAPRGRKSWALLAYLAATETSPSRQWLAELLFSDAEDPLNALSWCLSQLRRVLGDDVVLGGDPVRLQLPAGTFVDIEALRSGTWIQALGLPGLGQPLLGGMAFPTSPAFEVWLLAQRRHLAGVADDVIREAARSRLADGDARRAIDLASRLVAANPLDEDAQELLIRAYVHSGDRAAAIAARDACVALFRREMGTDPAQAVIHAADVETRAERAAETPTPTAVMACVEAGLAALDAGAIDSAISTLRQATTDAHRAGDARVQARALVALGSALVHGVRGRDGEGAQVLLHAVDVAERAGTDASAAQAYRELAYVELLRARYDRAQRWLHKAVDVAGTDPVEAAWAHAIRGLAWADVGSHDEGLRESHVALKLAREVDAGQVETWALTFIGRSHLLRRNLADARTNLQEALRAAHRTRWTAFVPLPESFLAEVDLIEGRIDEAAKGYEHAYALALQLGDPCWEGFAARGIGLVASRRGDHATALRWVNEARARCTRLPDAWLWVEAYCLDALCHLGTEQRHPDTKRWISDLESLAARTGMRELTARAYLHRGRAGDHRAQEAARVLAAEVDNPAVLTIG